MSAAPRLRTRRREEAPAQPAVTVAASPKRATEASVQPLPVVVFDEPVAPSPKPAPKPRARTKRSEPAPTPAPVPPAPQGWAKWIEALRAFRPSEGDGWHAEFQRYMAVLLSPIFTDSEVLNLAVGAPYINIFRRAFTHTSFSADDYEPLETAGDRILDTIFVQHVRARMPSATSRLITNFKVNYTSKTYQAGLATEMSMDKWVLLGAASRAAREDVTTLSVREDVLEAFIAALYQVANGIHQKFVAERRYEDAILRAVNGFEAVRVFVDFIFDEKGLSPKMGEDAAKSTLTEIGTIFGIRNRAIIFDSTPGADGTHSVRATSTLIRVLAENGIQDFPIVLAEGYPDKTSAAEAALARAEDFGVTRAWIADKREISRGVQMLPPDIREAVAQKAKSAGFTKVFTEIPESTRQPDGTFTLVLMGADARDERATLADAVGTTLRETRIAAANAYLRG